MFPTRLLKLISVADENLMISLNTTRFACYYVWCIRTCNTCSIGSVKGGGGWNSGVASPLRHSIAFSDVAASGYGIDVDVGVIKYHGTHIKTIPRDIATRAMRVKGHLRRLLRIVVCSKRVRMANIGITRDKEVNSRHKIAYLYNWYV